VIVSFLIIGVSLTLFLYWFRYTCVLILSAKTSRDYATQIASANHLTFRETRDTLMDESHAVPLEKIHQSLDRDYRLLTYLLRHVSSDTASGSSLENRILMIDFSLLTVWYGLTRRFSSPHARGALLEMASIVGHLANTMGERIAVGSSSS
jgi:hypothetical protein